mmetsp:Transcript_28611/g.90721  ORF Transcript_28611/g.90721 Transcript_28611/m.90721 type:complete len:246 (-) Transcript_28611:542-1279(-)
MGRRIARQPALPRVRQGTRHHARGLLAPLLTPTPHAAAGGLWAPLSPVSAFERPASSCRHPRDVEILRVALPASLFAWRHSSPRPGLSSPLPPPPWPQLAPRTAAERSRVIDSHAFDAFATRRRDGRSVLRAELDAHGIDTLLLAGCWTESCVLSTAVRAVAEDLNVAVASDAVFTCADAGPAALRVLGVYCCMVRAAEMSAYLRDLASAGTLAEADATAVERTAALPVALAQPLPTARAEPEAM